MVRGTLRAHRRCCASTSILALLFSFIALVGVSGQSCISPPSGLVAWWPANGNSIDIGGTNNGILTNGAGYGPGEVGQAFAFGGPSQAVDVGYSTNLHLQDFTIEAWIKRASSSTLSLDTNSGDAGNAAIFSYGPGGYGFAIYHDNRLLLTDVGARGVFSSTTISDTDFHYVAVTKANTTVTFYVDGANAGTVTKVRDVYRFTTQASIGALGSSQASSFFGLIDELAIYNRALASNEIQEIYAAGSAGKCLSPTLVAPPTDETGRVGGTNTFSVSALGLPPLRYQWFFNSNAVANATNSVFTIADVQLDDAGSYSVTVSNELSQVSASNATLTVLPAVSITSGLTNVPAGLGVSATFSVSAIGTPPLSYQWTFDGTNILDATNDSYGVTNIAFPDIGTYGVVVTDPWASVTNSALLAFNPQILVNGQLGTNFVFTNVPSAQVQLSSLFTNAAIFYTMDGSIPDTNSTPYTGLFSLTHSATLQATAFDQSSNSASSLSVRITILGSCTAPPAGLVSWWQGDDTALDVVGKNNGTLTNGVVFTNGEVGRAFLFDGTNQAVNVGLATNLWLQNFTIEAWIKRSDTNIASFEADNDGAIFAFGGGGYSLAMNGSGVAFLGQLGMNGKSASSAVTDTNWHHLAVTKSGTSVQFYLDGAAAGTATYNPVFSFTTNAAIGARGDNLHNSFDGAIDEISIYDRALSAAEIQEIHGASDEGKCCALAFVVQPTNEFGFKGQSNTFSAGVVGSFPVTYQWAFDSIAITNATNATLTVPSQSTNDGTYSVVASDPSGQLSSSNATLIAVVPVSITNSPADLNPQLGDPAELSVTATGTPPFFYQWSLDGTNILDATNDTYAISSVTFSNIGSYSVVVSNPWSFASASNTVTFNPQISVFDQLGDNFNFTNLSSIQVQISSAFSNATIFYTLDGSSPSFGSTEYHGAFAVTQSSTLQAVTYDQNFNAAYSYPVDITLYFSNTLTIINQGGGTVALNPPGGLYLNIQTVQLTATPTNGWTFLQWSGAVSSTSPTLNVPMSVNQNVQAVFGTPITFSPPQNGSLLFNPPGPIFAYGSTVQISALPNPGYYFALWGGSASSATNPYVLTVTNPNPNITSLFAALPQGEFSVVVYPNGNGFVSVNPPGNVFPSNASLSITATPTGTNKFYYWTGPVSISVNPLIIGDLRTNLFFTGNFSGGVYLLRFSPPQLNGTNFQFNLTGGPSGVYDIDTSSNLVDWTLLTAATNTAGLIPFVETISNVPQKFFRATLQ